MIVFVSDIHLTDGSSGKTINADAFRILRKQLRNLSYAASFRKGATYKPIETAHLVLLGDILDVIRSSQWLKGDARPWTSPRQKSFDDKVTDITNAILKKNEAATKVLRSISEGDDVVIPRGVKSGTISSVEHEKSEATTVPVKFSIHYQVGNHDWFYHLNRPGYESIRASIVKALGLANDPKVPFPWEPAESQVLTQIYSQHNVFARHGDRFDPFNFEGTRDASSLGDVIVVELLNRFPAEVAKRLSGLPEACLLGIREIDNIRPTLLAPVYLEGLLRRTCETSKQIDDVKAIWDELVDAFLKIKFVTQRDTWLPWDSVDKLKWALKFSQGVSLNSLGQVTSWVQEKIAPKERFYQHALTENAFKNRSAKHVVYGHTHTHEIVPLDISVQQDGSRLDQIYINTGTWRRVFEQARLNARDQEFIGFDVMTYAAFYLPDERRGKPFESWSGALG